MVVLILKLMVVMFVVRKKWSFIIIIYNLHYHVATVLMMVMTVLCQCVVKKDI